MIKKTIIFWGVFASIVGVICLFFTDLTHVTLTAIALAAIVGLCANLFTIMACCILDLYLGTNLFGVFLLSYGLGRFILLLYKKVPTVTFKDINSGTSH